MAKKMKLYDPSPRRHHTRGYKTELSRRMKGMWRSMYHRYDPKRRKSTAKRRRYAGRRYDPAALYYDPRRRSGKRKTFIGTLSRYAPMLGAGLGGLTMLRGGNPMGMAVGGVIGMVLGWAVQKFARGVPIAPKAGSFVKRFSGGMFGVGIAAALLAIVIGQATGKGRISLASLTGRALPSGTIPQYGQRAGMFGQQVMYPQSVPKTPMIYAGAGTQSTIDKLRASLGV